MRLSEFEKLIPVIGNQLKHTVQLKLNLN